MPPIETSSYQAQQGDGKGNGIGCPVLSILAHHLPLYPFHPLGLPCDNK
jgi:hypothetical protein